jgi:hypothetical protein
MKPIARTVYGNPMRGWSQMKMIGNRTPPVGLNRRLYERKRGTKLTGTCSRGDKPNRNTSSGGEASRYHGQGRDVDQATTQATAEPL